MADLAGIYYFDARPVSTEDYRQVRRGLLRNSAFSQWYTRPGLLIGCGAPAETIGDCHSGSTLPELGNICTFDGRLDNMHDLPGRHGHPHPPVPADHALTAYEARGVDGFRTLIGDWSLAIWDAAERAILLASDYAGIRPLYFHHAPSRLVWSSSLEHLARWTGIEELDEEFVAAFVTRGSAASRTPFRGIYPVPSGSSVRVSAGRLVQARYWSLPVGDQVRYRTEGEYEERMRFLFQEAVATRLRTSRPVCAELSGGLDSSSVVCTANRLIRAGAVKAPGLTSFSYQFQGSNDAGFYRAVEQACGIPSVYLDTEEYPPIAPDCAGYSQPCLWAPRLSEVARRMAALGSHVFLTGQGGDLIMGNWFDDAEQAADLFSQGRVVEAVRDAFAWSRALRVPVYSILWRTLRPASTDHPDWPRSAARRPETSLSPAFRQRVNLDSVESEPAWLRGLRPTLRKRVRALNRLLEGRILQCPEPLQAQSYTHPFAHRPLVEFMIGIPAGLVCRPGEPRRLMRRALVGIVPEVILRRRSKGNYDALFLRALRLSATELLRNVSRMRLVELGYVDSGSVHSRLLRLMQGVDCDASQLRCLLLLEFWLLRRQSRSTGGEWSPGPRRTASGAAAFPLTVSDDAKAP